MSQVSLKLTFPVNWTEVTLEVNLGSWTICSNFKGKHGQIKTNDLHTASDRDRPRTFSKWSFLWSSKTHWNQVSNELPVEKPYWLELEGHPRFNQLKSAKLRTHETDVSLCLFKVVFSFSHTADHPKAERLSVAVLASKVMNIKKRRTEKKKASKRARGEKRTRRWGCLAESPVPSILVLCWARKATWSNGSQNAMYWHHRYTNASITL